MISIELTPHQQDKFMYFMAKKLSWGNKECAALGQKVSSYSVTVDTDGKTYIIPELGEYTLEWNDDRFAITYTEEGNPVECHGIPMYFKRMRVAHEDADKLTAFVKDVVQYTDNRSDSKVDILNSKHTGYWDRGNRLGVQCINDIFIPNSTKNTIIEHIDTFVSSSEKYITFGRSYKLCFLLTGVPGSGKTSLIKAISLKYNRSLYVLCLSKKLDDEALIELIMSIKDNSILLVEDIDAFFVDRTAQSINVSFSTLINILDGTLAKANGMIIFMTANNPSMLDPALMRPGRVDRIVTFDFPRRSEILMAFERLIDAKNRQEPLSFNTFYEKIVGKHISMSAIVDYLFRHPVDYIEHIDDLVDSSKSYNDIISNKASAMYH